jgi:hypothetical protein
VNKLTISRKRFSETVWDVILSKESGTWTGVKVRDDLRSSADYNTGTISQSAVWDLYCIANYFKPRFVAEVGTFIGTSTWALADGMGDGEIHTCDAANDIVLEKHPTVDIVQYRKKTSTEMFNTMANRGLRADIIYLDGRLVEADYPLLGIITKPETIYVLDDTEGIEKGVINAANLMGSLSATHHFIYSHRSLTAMIIPKSLIEFTAQEIMQ